MLPRRPDDATPVFFDDVLMALDECGHRFLAYRRALADAGPHPDETEWFALIELEIATDRWRQRFLAALARRGMTVDDVLGPGDMSAAA